MSTETDEQQDPPGPPTRPARRAARRHRRRPRWWSGPLRLFVATLLVLAAAVFAGLAVTGRPLPAPQWVVSQIEQRVNAALGGRVRLSIGGIRAIVDDSFVPRVRLTDVTLYSPSGARLALLPDVRAVFGPAALLTGRLEPRVVRVAGVSVALRRLPDGRLDIPPAAGGGDLPAALTPSDMLAAVEKAFETPGLAALARIEVTGLAIRLDDERAGQSVEIADGSMTFEQTGRALHFALGFNLAAPGAAPGRAELDFTTFKGSPEARLDARLTGIRARTLAAQSPGFAWLGVFDAPISGTFRSGVTAEGRVDRLAATLDIGRGALRPDASAEPLAFERARLAMDYDPVTGALALDGLEIDSTTLKVSATAKAWLKGLETGFPTALVGQVALSRIRADPAGLFDNPVEFARGALDFKLDFAPFRIRIGQVSLSDSQSRIVGKGTASAGEGGWTLALDLSVDRIESSRLLALWPLGLVPKTRQWFARNVSAGLLSEVHGAVRTAPGQEPRLAFGYDFRDADVAVLRTLPPVRAGAGRATIFDNVYTMVLDEGRLDAPQGGPVNVAGSVLTVPDIRRKPAMAKVDLRTESSITAALALLDEPPFRFLTRAGQPVTAAAGRARIATRLGFALDGRIAPGDVDFDVEGELTDVTTETLVPGRPFAARSLTVRANPGGIEIGGEGTLSGVRFRGTWRQDFGPGSAGRSRVEAGVELSQRFLDAFSILLPPGSLRGEGIADVVLDLARGQATRFSLVSGLERVTLAIPGLGWTKPATAKARFTAHGTLGRPAKIEEMTLDAPGLALTGSVTLAEDGRLDRVDLPQIRVGGWFDGAAALLAGAPGEGVKLSVLGGRADLRRADFGGAGRGIPLDVALDRLTITDGLDLTGFRGSFSTAGGFSGTFGALVNAEAPITGTAAPLTNGTGFRIRSEDAGAVFRAGGIFTRARGGRLEATLRPTGEAGRYDGELTVKNIRVVNAPVLAELLGAVSVVGLIEQLNGSGIVFSDVAGQFRVQPGAVEITQGSAIGASLGVSAAGLVDTARGMVDLRGTISPVYLFNGLGRIFSKSREGLFGFNYRISGPTDGPKISVNPLSILTPGLFRELFRAPPPKLTP